MVEVVEVVGGQLDVSGGGVLPNVGRGPGAGDGADPVVVKNPRKRDLRRLCTLSFRHFFHNIDDTLVLFQILTGESRVVAAEIVFVMPPRDFRLSGPNASSAILSMARIAIGSYVELFSG